MIPIRHDGGGQLFLFFRANSLAFPVQEFEPLVRFRRQSDLGPVRISAPSFHHAGLFPVGLGDNVPNAFPDRFDLAVIPHSDDGFGHLRVLHGVALPPFEGESRIGHGFDLCVGIRFIGILAQQIPFPGLQSRFARLLDPVGRDFPQRIFRLPPGENGEDGMRQSSQKSRGQRWRQTLLTLLHRRQIPVPWLVRSAPPLGCRHAG